jgi:hypothetical protein
VSARCYLVVLQDGRGYPGPDDPLDPAPPEGPEPPTVVKVVKYEDYQKLLPKAADAGRIARAFHDTYERLAPAYDYETRLESRTHWALVPLENKKLMTAVVQTLLDEGVLSAAPPIAPHGRDASS